MMHGGTILRLTLAVLTAMWAPALCLCAMPAQAAEAPATHHAATPAQSAERVCNMADVPSGDACCCGTAMPVSAEGDSQSDVPPAHHRCSCDQDNDTRFVEARSASPSLVQLLPAFDVFVPPSSVAVAAGGLPVRGAYPFDSVDGPGRTSLLALGCQLTI